MTWFDSTTKSGIFFMTSNDFAQIVVYYLHFFDPSRATQCTQLLWACNKIDVNVGLRYSLWSLDHMLSPLPMSISYPQIDCGRCSSITHGWSIATQFFFAFSLHFRQRFYISTFHTEIPECYRESRRFGRFS